MDLPQAGRVLAELGIQDDPLLEVAMELERIALSDEYFIEKKLYPNVDFYSGIIYSALNIPTEMFTPMFALGRMPGWIAQWKEMVDGGTTKIGDPSGKDESRKLLDDAAIEQNKIGIKKNFQSFLKFEDSFTWHVEAIHNGTCENERAYVVNECQ